MKFPWNKYTELTLSKRNTLQVFITNRCNMKCTGCFARKAMGTDNQNISLDEYERVIIDFVQKEGKQINLLGGEPLLHPKLREILAINKKYELKTTIYTNGQAFEGYMPSEFEDVKLRVSIYSYKGEDKAKLPDNKSCLAIPEGHFEFDGNFMVSSTTTVQDLVMAATRCELVYGCKVFFISSLRELDNERQEFFDDTDLTMPVVQYKELVHRFMDLYQGDMDIHVSKRGVFESTTTLPCRKCHFANYFIGGKIIQCPYDVVNLKYQADYKFNSRDCQHNSSCLMSKVIYRKKKKNE